MTPQEKYRKSRKGVISMTYSNQRQTSSRRGHPMPTYSKEWISEWALAHPNFEQLYNDWVDGGYQRKMKPSIDRIKDELPYTETNIQLMTWKENDEKQNAKQMGSGVGGVYWNKRHNHWEASIRNNYKTTTILTSKDKLACEQALEDWLEKAIREIYLYRFQH